MIAELPIIKSRRFWAIGIPLAPLLVACAVLFTPDAIYAISCPNGSTHCPGDLTGDGRINCCDITQTELCILYPEIYPKENYPGWDSNGDGKGPDSGDILGSEWIRLGQVPLGLPFHSPHLQVDPPTWPAPPSTIHPPVLLPGRPRRRYTEDRSHPQDNQPQPSVAELQRLAHPKSVPTH
jgi:hypothetical protein